MSGTSPKKNRRIIKIAPEDLRVSVVVVTYHTGPSLDACLKSLLSDAWVSEIILVDNGNTPLVSSRLRAFAADRRNVMLVQGQGNVGFGRGANLGAAVAASKYVLFLNPDARLEAGAIKSMLGAAQALKDEPVFILGGRVLGEDGREQRGARREKITPWSALVAGFGLGRFEKWQPAFRDPHREKDPVPGVPVPTPVISGAFFMTTVSGFLGLGGFDERYFLHVEDIDLCRRVWDAGGKVVFHPGAKVFHVGASSDVSSMFVARAKARSFILYFLKFAKSPAQKVGAIAAGLVVGAGLIARAAISAVRPRRERT
jgi:N-acetylglucosaminyl-diphospho-decaprenol L-rhamnosyltransferase